MTLPVTAGAMLISPDSRLLFGLRASWKRTWPNTWDAIGGHVEPGETPEQAMLREVFEEVGVTPTAYGLAAMVLDPSDGHPCHIFYVTAWEGSPRIMNDEHDALDWFTPEALDALPNLAGEGYPRLARLALSAAARARGP